MNCKLSTASPIHLQEIKDPLNRFKKKKKKKKITSFVQTTVRQGLSRK